MTKRKQEKPETETTSKKLKNEELKDLIKLRNWEISNNIEQKAFELAFSDEDERIVFLKNLLQYWRVVVNSYNEKEKLFPKNRKDPLYKDVEEWKKIFEGPRKGANYKVTNLEKMINELETKLETESSTE